ncbi:MAG: hypothetical protein RBU27_05800 [Bacteroidota bacterium]|nr:hypothetical protein [Bacteroidota bacterium]
MKRILALLSLLLCVLAVDAAGQMRGLRNAPRERSWRIGIEGGIVTLGGELTRNTGDHFPTPYGNIELAHMLHRNVVVGLYGGGGRLLSREDGLESDAVFLGGGILVELRIALARGSVFPLLQLRGGGLLLSPEIRANTHSVTHDQIRHMSYGIAAGIEAVSWRHIGIRLLAGVTYTTTDNLDAIIRGDDNDGFSFGTVSLHYYFGGGRR